MNKIIQLPASSLPHSSVSSYSKAGWLLVSNALWQHDAFSKQEIQVVQQKIQQLLRSGHGYKSTFIEFCERVLLAKRLLQADPTNWIDVPTIWFHPHYAEGFAGTTMVYQQVLVKRQSMPHYQAGVCVFANAYWSYINAPSIAILKQCNNRLLKFKEYGLLQLWNNVIIHFQIQSNIL